MSSASATSLVDTPLVRSLLTIHCLTTYKEACQRGEVAMGRCWLSRPTNSTDQRTSSISPPRSTGAPSQLSYIDAGLVDLVVPMCCIALIMVAARRIEFSYTRALVQCRGGGRAVVADRWLAGALAGGSAGRCVWLATALAPPVAGLRGLGGIVGPSARSALAAGQGSAGQVSWRYRDRGRDGGVDGIGRLGTSLGYRHRAQPSAT